MQSFGLKITIWALLIGLTVAVNTACGRKGALVLPDDVAAKIALEKKEKENKEKAKEKETPASESSPEPQ